MIRSHQTFALTLGVCATLGVHDAAAVRQSEHPTGTTLADGRAARAVRTVTSATPRTMATAWQRFRSSHPGSWLATWDEVTKVPTRIFGSGIEAPGTAADGKTAEAMARRLLREHLDLLAPGASEGDFVLVTNEDSGGGRVVAFLQHVHGLRVLGGQLSFRFRNDRLFMIASEARPHAVGSRPGTVLSEAAARSRAEQWIETLFAGDALADDVDGPFVMPMVRRGIFDGYRTVLRVVVSSKKPRARWHVLLDAAEGTPVAREQTLRFASGTLAYDAGVRYPSAERANYPARFAEVDSGGTITTADAGGLITFADPAPVDFATLLTSSRVRVFNVVGPEATTTLPFVADGTMVWSEADDPQLDSQLTSYIHAHIAKEHALILAPDLAWIDAQLPVNVNENDICNAYYDGQSINFFQESPGQCENTGRLADVVYHEFGHGLHHHAVLTGSGEFESALSEGVSDYYAASITGDPAMGRGFFLGEEPLRHIDPAGEASWPDDISFDPHATGLIIAGALWDLRVLLIDKYGEEEGDALTDALFYESMRHAVDIPSMYPEVLAADDDDGNLANGSPNVCEIIDAFTRHGLRTVSLEAETPTVAPPTSDGYKVSIRIEGLFPDCPSDQLDSAELVWAVRRTPDLESTIAMTGSGSEFEAEIPAQEPGDVVLYRVNVDLALGASLSFPDNPADPMYQMFVGEVVPIYCTDFETDPEADGWTHGLSAGEPGEGADDWQWGEPRGDSLNGDPSEAFSGNRVFGNDLGGGDYNGNYQPDKTNYAETPEIDVSQYGHVRLHQRRWLQVEDGFFDQANIYVNDQLAWTNFASEDDNDGVHHRDREWRFQDIEVTPFVTDGTVKIRYEIVSDQGLELGGWTLDDVCVVAYEGMPPGACGDGTIDVGEGCDDGNTSDGDGCSATCQPDTAPGAEGGDTVVEDGCACSAPGAGGGSSRTGALALCLALGIAGARRRRSQPVCAGRS
jgi:cysteine-rich repeat protein